MHEPDRNRGLHPAAQSELGTDDARAGVTGHKVRYVLGFSLAGVILAFAALGLLAVQGWL